MQTDPIGYEDNMNLYGLTANDPVNNTDPSGLAGFSAAANKPLGGTDEQNEVISAAIDFVPVVVDIKGTTEFLQNPSLIGGAALVVSYVPFLGDAAAKFIKGFGKNADSASGLGDLTRGEVDQIQNVVNEAGRPLDVVGSAARGERRGVGSNLPIGKGTGTRSDTDFTTAGANRGNFDGLENRLPNADPNAPVLQGTPNAGAPSIRFEPNTQPRKIDEN